jgi:hypothetical protein
MKNGYVVRGAFSPSRARLYSAQCSFGQLFDRVIYCHQGAWLSRFGKATNIFAQSFDKQRYSNTRW